MLHPEWSSRVTWTQSIIPLFAHAQLTNWAQHALGLRLLLMAQYSLSPATEMPSPYSRSISAAMSSHTSGGPTACLSLPNASPPQNNVQSQRLHLRHYWAEKGISPLYIIYVLLSTIISGLREDFAEGFWDQIWDLRCTFSVGTHKADRHPSMMLLPTLLSPAVEGYLLFTVRLWMTPRTPPASPWGWLLTHRQVCASVRTWPTSWQQVEQAYPSC